MMRIMTAINMAFKPWREKRERGEKFPAGFIKRKIVLIISNQFPKGMKEPDLRDTLREGWGISEPKGVKIHLNDLKEKKVLVKGEKRGFPNVWKLSQDYETFKCLAKEFHNSEDEVEFLKSGYAQLMINKEFVDHFAVDWGREYVRFLSKPDTQTSFGKPLEDFQPEELREHFYSGLVGLEKRGLIEILQISPSSLYNFLFPEEVVPSLTSGVPLSTFFLVPFAQDASIYGIPKGKGIETKIEVEYGDVKNIRGETKIAPSVKAKSHFKIFVAPKVPSIRIRIPPKSAFTMMAAKDKKNVEGASHADNS